MTQRMRHLKSDKFLEAVLLKPTRRAKPDLSALTAVLKRAFYLKHF